MTGKRWCNAATTYQRVMKAKGKPLRTQALFGKQVINHILIIIVKHYIYVFLMKCGFVKIAWSGKKERKKGRENGFT